MMPGLVAKAILCLGPIQIKANQIKFRQHSTGGGRQRDLWTVMSSTNLPSSEWHRWAIHIHLSPCHTAWVGNCHPGTHQKWASLKWEPPQCASMWWSHGREREEEQPELYGERWNWRIVGGEEWLAVKGEPCYRGGEIPAQVATGTNPSLCLHSSRG